MQAHSTLAANRHGITKWTQVLRSKGRRDFSGHAYCHGRRSVSKRLSQLSFTECAILSRDLVRKGQATMPNYRYKDWGTFRDAEAPRERLYLVAVDRQLQCCIFYRFKQWPAYNENQSFTCTAMPQSRREKWRILFANLNWCQNTLLVHETGDLLIKYRPQTRRSL
jgi:hypothetical protein